MIVFEIRGNKGEGSQQQCLNLVEQLKHSPDVYQIMLLDTVGFTYTHPTEQFPFVADVQTEGQLKDILSFNFPERTACIQVYNLNEDNVSEIVRGYQENIKDVNCHQKRILIILKMPV